MSQIETSQPAASDALPTARQFWPRATAAAERRELWWQLAVALSVGVIPHLLRAVLSLFDERSDETSSVAGSVFVLVTSLSVIVVMLYLIRQSREPRERFGLVWSNKADPALAVAVFIANLMVHVLLSPCIVSFMDPDVWSVPNYFKGPSGPAEFALMVVAQSANGTAEELSIWAVVFTRLVRLRGSPWSCVMLASAAFASYHVYQGLYGALMIFGYGFCHGAIFVGLRRLWPLVLAHAGLDIILFAQA